MAVLFVVGLMNLAWMAGIAIVVHPVLLSSVTHTALSTPSSMMMGG